MNLPPLPEPDMDDIKAIRDALEHIANANRGEGAYGLRSAADNFSAILHPKRIARLLDALELAQKDAARWRHVRAATEIADTVLTRGPAADLDAEIDAAIAASAPQSPAADQSTP